MITSLIPIGLGFILYYYLVVVPKQKADKEHQQLLRTLRRGDRVLTNSGITGFIKSTHNDLIIIEIAHNYSLTVHRTSVLCRI